MCAGNCYASEQEIHVTFTQEMWELWYTLFRISLVDFWLSWNRTREC